jgi:hypothetical protein
MSNTGVALAYLRGLEDEAAHHHKKVAEYLEAIRVLLDRATVQRYGKIYQLSGLRAYRGFVKAYGVRIYSGKAGVRAYDLGDLRECQLIAYFDQNNPIPKKPRGRPRDVCWHQSHPNHGDTNQKTKEPDPKHLRFAGS